MPRGRSYPSVCNVCGMKDTQVLDDHAWINHCERCWEEENYGKYIKYLGKKKCWYGKDCKRKECNFSHETKLKLNDIKEFPPLG